MDPDSERIQMNFGVWYGTAGGVKAIIDSIVDCAKNSTSPKRRLDIAELLRRAASEVFHYQDDGK